ncbi:transcriptional regulator [Agrilactobacillus composti DSM 18527 = JCM 14202]|uniref:Transcriptional regulator n=1 Tax=Agrilactobacillus composti DSM 18527 = JCM 14202 TaxID=1423734 RepID=X0PFL3_9LACO|nr:TetR family transcriptional regulator [Agrilactobacillus composti]KRM33413.1 transcriptional regulator [Agrilactobacillus composti DSM 18527 = JCM 14202]GAF40744.1 transcriptional regulator, TetR family [Agrilactobacillus composti DSM 18527 = JCM 14202]
MLETEIKIQKAFVQIIQEQSFDKLSVQQLAKTAHISRGTFYLHYLDKYDLLTHYENEIVTDITGIFNRFPKPRDTVAIATGFENNAFYQLFKYLYRQRDLAGLLLREPAADLVKKVQQLINTVLPQTSAAIGKSPDFPVSFAQEIVTRGIIDFIIFWLTQPPILAPKPAYLIFQKSRTLTPKQLTDIVIQAKQGH